MTLLVLWDVDHTLIENSGVSKETYAAAFQLLAGHPARVRPRTNGRTDPEIISDLLRDHGLDPADVTSEAMYHALRTAMVANIPALRERGYECPGAREAIAALSAVPGVIQSVLSGNIRDNAFVKVSTFDLHRDLDWEVGAYGSDGDHRPALVKIAQQRAEHRYGTTFDAANTVLIGDTVNDVRAGLRGGARVLAVATGVDSAQTLRDEGATVVLPDLRDTTSVLNAVTGVVRRSD